MGISTNAGLNDTLSPAARRAVEGEDATQGIMQDAERDAKLAAARGQRASDLNPIQLEAQQKIEQKDADGNVVQFDGIGLEFESREPDYDASIPSLAPYVVGGVWEECTWWPFRMAGARAGLKPRLGPKAWEAIMDAGMYCMRCLCRHASPFPEECAGCSLTRATYLQALEVMEHGMKLVERPAATRDQRRAMKRAERKSKGGVVLPGLG